MTAYAPHLLLLLDGSGSMYSSGEILVRSVNWFLDEQKKLLAPCDVTICSFHGHMVKTLFKQVPIHMVGEIQHSHSEYYPSGGTNARDTMHQQVQECLTRPTLVCLLTDGEDGSSDYSIGQSETLVKRLTTSGWLFTYIGFGGGAVPARIYGIEDKHSIMVDQDEAGAQTAVRALSMASIAYRCGEKDFAKVMRDAIESSKGRLK